MSLCYDFQKWTILTLGLVAASLTIGLISIAHGFVDGNNNGKDDVLDTINELNENGSQGTRYTFCRMYDFNWDGLYCHFKGQGQKQGEEIKAGFVDGNNNSKDDRIEWIDSIFPDPNENQKREYMKCYYTNGTWNGSTCD